MEYRSSFNRNRIAYLGALTLLFSYAEMLLPRGIPFFRLGLGNIAVLLAFNLNFVSFFVLTVIKAIASSLMAGTLFSPFLFISLAQSVISGMAMYGLVKITRGKLFSLYGISVFGSAISALVQIGLSSLYLGKGTLSLLGPMLLFSAVSGIITAFFAGLFNLAETTPELIYSDEQQEKTNKSSILKVIFLLLFAVFIFTIHNIYVLLAAMILSFILQIMSGRRIMILPHITMWIFVVISCLCVPQGQVLYKTGFISITEGALLTAVEKSLKLSAVSALSQCLAGIKPSGKGLLSQVLSYFGGMCDIMQNTKGNLITKVSAALKANEIYCR